MRQTPLKYKKMRRKKFLDHSIQGWMIGLMLFSQLSFLIFGIVLFYNEFLNLIDQYLYSIHGLDLAIFSHQVRILSGKIIIIYLTINFIGLIVAHYIWVNFITRVLQEFNDLTEKTRALNFTKDSTKSSHLVNEVAKKWRKYQAKKWKKIISCIDQIPDNEADLIMNKKLVCERLKDLKK